MPGTPGTPSESWYAYSNLPTELQNYAPFAGSPSYRFSGATLTYTSDWNASATTPQAAYRWSAFCNQPASPYGNFLMSGVGYVANASVSTTPVVKLITASYFAQPGSGFSVYGSKTQSELMAHTEDTLYNGVTQWFNDLGFCTLTAYSNGVLDPNDQTVGGGITSWTATGSANVHPVAVFPTLAITAS